MKNSSNVMSDLPFSICFFLNILIISCIQVSKKLYCCRLSVSCKGNFASWKLSYSIFWFFSLVAIVWKCSSCWYGLWIYQFNERKWAHKIHLKGRYYMWDTWWDSDRCNLNYQFQLKLMKCYSWRNMIEWSSGQTQLGTCRRLRVSKVLFRTFFF